MMDVFVSPVHDAAPHEAFVRVVDCHVIKISNLILLFAQVVQMSKKAKTKILMLWQDLR